jgi:hypothetical protein
LIHIANFRKNRIFWVGIIIALVVLLAGAFIGYVYTTRNKNLAARVNKQVVTIEELNNRSAQTSQFFQYSKQNFDDYNIKTQTLNNLIDLRLIEDFVAKNNISVDSAKIEALYQLRINAFKSETSLLKKIDELYGIDKNQFLETLREDLLRQAIAEKTNQPFADWLKEQRAQSKIVIYKY